MNYGFGKIVDKRRIDPTLKPFVKGLFGALLKILLAVSLTSRLGIEMTSFVAIIGAAGLALSGTLQNFAGSIIILIFKPYQVGDLMTRLSTSPIPQK